MQHEEELTLERDDDPLAHSPDADDFPPSAEAIGGITLRSTKGS